MVTPTSTEQKWKIAFLIFLIVALSLVIWSSVSSGIDYIPTSKTTPKPEKAQWARKFKKVQTKKTCEIKHINFIGEKIGQISFFAISKMTKNQFWNWETAKNAISRKKILIYLIS